ncbi:MAG TPA: multiheme c-type cytochrome [Chthonomonadaceae bacterium]|nr:multiheme c-type cytochrome [Chthonomonadaceae bacterium]
MQPSMRRLVCLLFVGPVCALLITAGCTRNTKPPAPPPTDVAPPVAQLPANDFVGSEACNPCHAEEWRKHRESRHAHTFRPMMVSALGKSAPPEGLLQGTNSALGVVGDHYVLVRPQTGQQRPLDYALGSGKQGMTYIAIVQDTAVFEMRVSFTPRTRQWYPTPGQEQYENFPNVVGKTHLKTEARQCLLCHTVTVADNDLHPEPRFMGVGCESCHGAGSAHIAAAKAGRMNDLKMEHLATAGGKRLNALCGVCHQTPENVAQMPQNQRLTQRFMPYGLAQSRCFQQSGDRLTCVTCHDPHTDAGTDRRVYEKTCLQCHSGSHAPAVTDKGVASTASVPGKVCPINPREGCVGCHMPKRKVFAGNAIPIAMADHWIKVNK